MVSLVPFETLFGLYQGEYYPTVTEILRVMVRIGRRLEGPDLADVQKMVWRLSCAKTDYELKGTEIEGSLVDDAVVLIEKVTGAKLAVSFEYVVVQTIGGEDKAEDVS